MKRRWMTQDQLIRVACWLVVAVMFGNCIYAAWIRTPMVVFAVAGLLYCLVGAVDATRGGSSQPGGQQ